MTEKTGQIVEHHLELADVPEFVILDVVFFHGTAFLRLPSEGGKSASGIFPGGKHFIAE